MRLHVLSFLAIGLLVAFGSVRSDEKKKMNLDGAWKLESGEQAGEDIEKDALKTSEMKIEGTTFSFKLGDIDLKGKLKLDFDKKPLTVDAEITEGQQQGMTFQGIFEMVDENTMKQCYAGPGEDRPTRFSTKEGKGGGQYYFVWKREKKGEKAEKAEKPGK
jgi:uncharacterized protein (TIGR03067 family)